jgi:hypothetical protein
MPSSAFPSPLQDFTSRIKSLAFRELNHSEEILDAADQTSQSGSPVIYLSPDYYFFTQWIAAVNRNWSTTLQQNIDQIVAKKGVNGDPDLLDVNQGISGWTPNEIYHD